MQPHINQEDLHKDNLSWLCIEPVLISVRGKSLDIKSEVYNQLNEGQRALYLFYAFHNHVKSNVELYWFAAYFMNELKAWRGLKEGIAFFKDNEMLMLMEELETIIEDKNRDINGLWREASPSDLEKDMNLSDSINQIYSEYQVNVQQTIEAMNSYIRNNEEDFII
ncbi:hypothetical protein [Paenibacillus wynnii]|uniref:DUF4375 domain-containing protein n=1 Tax=Paenibacillus wynnii TaxID=268407 RepID=A0A098M5K4_9BACL|nr:hypothetical protein [Paenibacillus wynnii]KGE16837.1 hypothetical protein PWYN_19315 [Paenibacillus wynnii]